MPVFELEWENQNAVAWYPFTQTQIVNSVIVDASFQQFDGFIPIVNYILVSPTSLTVNLTYDTGTANFVLTQANYNAGLNYIRLAVGTRYLGRVVFGVGAASLWANSVGQKLTYNMAFVPTTVRSIKSDCGVFTISSLYGNVEFANSTNDNAIFFNTATTNSRNQVTMNAVQNHKFLSDPPPQALLQINLITPNDNNIFIASSDVLQINGTSVGGLNISLVGSAGINVFSNMTPIASTLGY